MTTSIFRDLTLLREKACCKVSSELALEEIVHRLEEYLILLHNFTAKVASLLCKALSSFICMQANLLHCRQMHT